MVNDNYSILFNVSKNCFFKIILACNKKDICFCNEIDILFQCNEKSYIIYSQDCILNALQTINFLFKEAILNKLQLHSSIYEDIGYLWNEYLYKDEYNAHKFLKNEYGWIGTDYLISSCHGIATWLYQKNDKIYLEITSVYPWHFSDPQPGENYITYEEFMKNYKPLEIIELDKETIKKWLAQTEELLEIMKINEEKAEKEYEAKQQKAS